MAELTHYDILQVSTKAEHEVIEAAYRKLAFKYHPDRNSDPGATELMKQLSEARDVLLDTTRRVAYDLELSNRNQRQGFTTAPPAQAVAFTCPRCKLGIEIKLESIQDYLRCPGCNQKIRLKPSAIPVGRPSDWPNPITASFGNDELDQIKILEKLRKNPGNAYLYYWLPVVAALLIAGLFLSTSAFHAGAASTGRALFATFRFIVILSSCGGVGAWCYFRGIKLNREYVAAAHPLRIDYTLTPGQQSRYRSLIMAFQNMAYSTDVWESNNHSKGVVLGDPISIFRKSPRWVHSNVDLYQLQIQDVRLYFLPDGVLVEYWHSYALFRYHDLDVNVKNISVYLGEQVVGYRWKHQRLDGGPDGRYKNNFETPIYRSEYENCPALEIGYDNERLTLLSNSGEILTQFKQAVAELSQLGIRYAE